MLLIALSGCSLFRKGHRHKNVAPVTDTSKVAADTLLRDTLNVTSITPVPDSIKPPVVMTAEKQQQIRDVQPVWQRSLVYTTFSGKAKVHYEGKGDKQDFAANIRIEKDKRIWISITALGLIEVARALITPDTIMMIDRMHKEYRILPFSEAGKLLPIAVEFTTLQNLLVGDVLQRKDSITDVLLTADGISIEINTLQYQQQVTYKKADSSIIQQNLKAGSVAVPLSLSMQFNDYGLIDDHKFSNSRVIDIQNNQDPYHIEMDFNRADFNQPLEFSFSIPSKYQRK